MSDERPVVRLPEQAGDIQIGQAASNIYHQLADLPPGLRQVLADDHEAILLMVKALERQGDAVERIGNRQTRLEQEFRAYTTGEALERYERQLEQDRQKTAEQGMLMNGLNGIRAMIGEQGTRIGMMETRIQGILLSAMEQEKAAAARAAFWRLMQRRVLIGLIGLVVVLEAVGVLLWVRF